MVCLHLIRLGRLVRHSTLSIQAKHCFGNKNGSCQDRSGDQSESELWLRNASDREGGNISAFEDEFGNHLRPTGQLTDSFPLRTAKSRALRNKTSHFVDWRRVKFKAGNGGKGMISFLQLFANDRAGPDGGDGGNGGHLVLKADSQVKSLSNVQALYFGQKGENGGSRDLTGASGNHIFIPVPVGTLVKIEMAPATETPVAVADSPGRPADDSLDVVRNNFSQNSLMHKHLYKVVADLSENGDLFVAARGGAGGKGNHFFLSNENRQPRVAEQGGEGEQQVYCLEMKTIAHVGLVGFPNAGKSTLLRGVSRARPKVAAYPFTTLQPQLGIVSFSDDVQLVVADLPGLIEGAHANRGLGHSFLRHLDRCVCLVYVLDLSQPNAVQQFQVLRNELDLFKAGLSKRPHAIVGNKIDLDGAQDQLVQLRAYIKQNTPNDEMPLPVIPISAKFGTNLLEYLKHIRGLYDLYNQPEVDEPGFQW